MSKPLILIGLRNPIDAFSLQPTEVEALTQAVGRIYDIQVADSKNDFLANLPSAEIVICWKFAVEWYGLAPKLNAIYTPSAGRDWIAPDPEGRVPVDHGSFHGPLMRESLLAMMLYFNRRLDLAVGDKRNKEWNRNRYSDVRALTGQNVMIIGYGSIGRSCAEVLKALGCHITGVRRTPQSEDTFADHIITMADMPTYLPDMDQVVCVLPGDSSTEGIITADHFSRMKEGAYIYNLGRGNCYAEADLIQALTQGPLAGAGLDVFAEEPLPESSPLWELDNVFIMPHASAICRNYLPAYIKELIPKLTNGV